MLFCFVLMEKIKMFLIQFNNFCIAKKSKLPTVPRFCTHYYRNTVVLENKLLVFLIFLQPIIIGQKNWTQTTRIGNKSTFNQLKSNMEVWNIGWERIPFDSPIKTLRVKPEKVGWQVDTAVSLVCLRSKKKFTCLLLPSMSDVMQQHSFYPARVYMEIHAFQVEIYRPQTCIATTK